MRTYGFTMRIATRRKLTQRQRDELAAMLVAQVEALDDGDIARGIGATVTFSRFNEFKPGRKPK